MLVSRQLHGIAISKEKPSSVYNTKAYIGQLTYNLDFLKPASIIKLLAILNIYELFNIAVLSLLYLMHMMFYNHKSNF